MQEQVGSSVYKLKLFKVVSRYSNQCLQQIQQAAWQKSIALIDHVIWSYVNAN